MIVEPRQSEHMLKMSRYNNHLIQLGVNLPDDSVINRILQSPSQSYWNFVMNYNARDDENDSRALRDAKIDEGRNQEKSIKC